MDSPEPRRGPGRPPRPDGPMPPFTIRLEPEQRRRVEAAATPEDGNLSETIRRLLDEATTGTGLSDEDLAVILGALDDGNRYWQLRWSLCHQCRPGRICPRHAEGEGPARSYRELLARLGGDSGE